MHLKDSIPMNLSSQRLIKSSESSYENCRLAVLLRPTLKDNPSTKLLDGAGVVQLIVICLSLQMAFHKGNFRIQNGSELTSVVLCFDSAKAKSNVQASKTGTLLLRCWGLSADVLEGCNNRGWRITAALSYEKFKSNRIRSHNAFSRMLNHLSCHFYGH